MSAGWRQIRDRITRWPWRRLWPGWEGFWLTATAAVVLVGVALVLAGCPRRSEPERADRSVPALSHWGAAVATRATPRATPYATPHGTSAATPGPVPRLAPLAPPSQSGADSQSPPGPEASRELTSPASADSVDPDPAARPPALPSSALPPALPPDGASVSAGEPAAHPLMIPTLGENGRRPQPGQPRPAPSRPTVGRARLAVVIDDWGYGWKAAREILALPYPLTAAVLPDAPYSQEQARAAAAAGFQVILHLPMQPLADLPLPALAVRVGQTEAEIRQQLATALKQIPAAVGVSNHEGSRATADRRVMETLLADVRDRGLFFLDSRTGPSSVVAEVAHQLQTPVLENTLFIDNVDSVYTILARLRQGAEIARRRGRAIVIGHVRQATAQALALILPELAHEGIELVPVSDLLPAAGPSSGVVK